MGAPPAKRLTQAYLWHLFDYNPKTGRLVWKNPLPPRGKAGREPGWMTVGYRQVSINQRRFPLTHIIWKMMYGKWPTRFIDHKDGVTSGRGNRIKNLREATNQQNMRNGSRRVTNKAGFKGVHRRPETGKYRACLTVDARTIWLGQTETAEESALRYDAAAKKHFGRFARLNFPKAA